MAVAKRSSKSVSTTIIKALNIEGRVTHRTLQSFLAGQGRGKKPPHEMEHRGSHSPIPTVSKILQSMPHRKTSDLTGGFKLNTEQKDRT